MQEHAEPNYDSQAVQRTKDQEIIRITMPTTILLADDHPVFRQRVRAFLDQDPELRVVGEAEDGQAAVIRAQELMLQENSPDTVLVVLMDVMMPNLNGVEATRQILSGAPAIKILALSLHTERQWVEAMVKAGASGYVLKDDPFSDLVQAIRKVAAGETYFSSGLGSLCLFPMTQAPF